MLSIRHSIGKTPLLEHMANDSKSVAHFRCYAIAPPPGVYARLSSLLSDFSVVLFRPHFMLASEEYPMKVHKNQWLSAPLSSPDLPCGATNQGTHPGVWDAAD